MASQGVKEIWCGECHAFTRLIEEKPQRDGHNPYPWGDLVCGRCGFIVATIRIKEEE